MNISEETGYPTYVYREEKDGKILVKIRFLNPHLCMVKEFTDQVDLTYLSAVDHISGDNKNCGIFQTLKGVLTIDFPPEEDQYWTLVEEESGLSNILTPSHRH